MAFVFVTAALETIGHILSSAALINRKVSSLISSPRGDEFFHLTTSFLPFLGITLPIHDRRTQHSASCHTDRRSIEGLQQHAYLSPANRGRLASHPTVVVFFFTYAVC